MKREYRQATPDELDALQRFANAHPRGGETTTTWRDELSMIYWYNARLWTGELGTDGNVGSVLHGIRNDLGPTWLYDHCTITPARKAKP